MSDSVENASYEYCTQCGTPLAEGAKFCNNCGHRIFSEQDSSGSGDSKDSVSHDTDAFTEATGVLNAVSSSSSNAQGQNQQNQPKSASEETTVSIPVDQVLGADQSTAETHEIPSVPQYSTPPVSETTPLPRVTESETLTSPYGQPVSYSAQDNSAAQSGTNKKRIIIIVGIIVAVIAIVVVAFVLQSLNSETTVVVNDATEDTSQIVVNLTDTYTTQYADETNAEYPTFSFKYPDSWSITDHSVSSRGEIVELTNDDDGTVITYYQRTTGANSSDSVSFNDVEKVASTSFTPSTVHNTDYSDLGQFIVANGTLNINGTDEGTCYALVPSSALDDSSDLDLRNGVPGFWYASSVYFVSQPSDDVSDQTEQEIIAILASFTETAAASSSDDEDDDTITVGSDDYVLPESASRYYSKSELSELSNYELYIARNEIFARHGRAFNNEDLQEYFGSKSWYTATVDPDDFDSSVFNKYEKENIERISEIENDRGSSYIS